MGMIVVMCMAVVLMIMVVIMSMGVRCSIRMGMGMGMCRRTRSAFDFHFAARAATNRTHRVVSSTLFDFNFLDPHGQTLGRLHLMATAVRAAAIAFIHRDFGGTGQADALPW